MTSYLEGYQAGEYKAVWKELIELKDRILEPEIYDDAVEVARETMKRVRYNCEMTYAKLIELKYKFFNPKSAFIGANPDERQGHIEEAEEFLHKIPLSVRMWYEEVGGIWLIGEHTYLSSETIYGKTAIMSDPFCCYFDALEPGHLTPDFVDEYYDREIVDFSPV